MANLEAGTYQIVSAAATGSALSVDGGARAGVRDGASVSVGARNWSDAQVFRVSYRESDGTAQILNRLSGKSLSDLGATPAAGNPIGIWTDNDDFTQAWDVADAGSTVTVDGESHPTFRLTLHGTSLRLASSDGNAVLATASTANVQKWAFIPIPDLADGGVYELVSFDDKRKCLAMGGSSTADGAAACIYARMGINDQKWYLEDSANGWRVRNVHSEKVLCVNAVDLAAGLPVVQWQVVQGMYHSYWNIGTYSTDEVDGVQRRMVTFGADNAQNYQITSMPPYGVQIHPTAALNRQYWMLVPTTVNDPRLSAPYALDTVAEVGSEEHADPTAAWGASMRFSFVPTWCAPDALATNGPTSFQYRTRVRYMDADSSAWRKWGAWGEWAHAGVTREGNRYWLTEGLSVSMDDSCKLAQAEIEVRTCVAVEGSLRYGGSASLDAVCCPVPEVSFAGATYTSEGLAIGVSSAYSCGSLAFDFDSVISDGESVLNEPASATVDGGSGYAVIPWDKLLYLPENGDALSIGYRVGTDQKRALTGILEAAATLSYTAAGAQPTIAEGPGRTLDLTSPAGYSSAAWIVLDGRRVDLAEHGGAFSVLYPFGASYALCAAGTDGSGFFVHRSDRTGDGACHALNWPGGYALVELRGGDALAVEDTVEAEYDAHILDVRPYETVTFAPTRKHRFTVAGALVDGLTGSQRGDFDTIAGIHATYRSPAGDICPVAVVSASRTAHAKWTEVSLSLVREG